VRLVSQISEILANVLREEVETLTNGRVPPERRSVEVRVLAPVVQVNVSALYNDGLNAEGVEDVDDPLERRASMQGSVDLP
jgi:hypothetical protein